MKLSQMDEKKFSQITQCRLLSSSAIQIDKLMATSNEFVRNADKNAARYGPVTAEVLMNKPIEWQRYERYSKHVININLQLNDILTQNGVREWSRKEEESCIMKYLCEQPFLAGGENQWLAAVIDGSVEEKNERIGIKYLLSDEDPVLIRKMIQYEMLVANFKRMILVELDDSFVVTNISVIDRESKDLERMKKNLYMWTSVFYQWFWSGNKPVPAKTLLADVEKYKLPVTFTKGKPEVFLK